MATSVERVRPAPAGFTKSSRRLPRSSPSDERGGLGLHPAADATGPIVSRKSPTMLGHIKEPAIIDGEIVVPAADGTTDFSVLQNELKGKSKSIVLVAFDSCLPERAATS